MNNSTSQPAQPHYPLKDDELIDTLQRDVLGYFDIERNPANGLVPDSTADNSACSIASVGLALASWCCAVHAGHARRDKARNIVLATLQTFANLSRSDASCHRGFFYHFLDMQTGRRHQDSELSSIDTALLIAGALVARQFFDQDDSEEFEIRQLADDLYRGVDWQWMHDGGPTPRMGWKPESGFMPPRWLGYSEGLLVMLLAIGSPTHPIPPDSYKAFCESYVWVEQFGHRHLRAGPLFIHQLTHCFVDFRDIADEFMRARGSDYFQNSAAATHVQQGYALSNPGGFVGYGKHCWGLTASNGPGPAKRKIDGRDFQFFDYTARGVSAPGGGKQDPDDGTLSPWAVAASLTFAPGIVLPTLHHFMHLGLGATGGYGFKATFNQTFKDENSPTGFWISADTFGLNQGPIVLMVENYRSGLVWRLMRQCEYLKTALRRAGFRGGWIE